jgi:hypothetical protein
MLQDLEIYISKKKVENGYALVARAGRVVQVGVRAGRTIHALLTDVCMGKLYGTSSRHNSIYSTSHQDAMSFSGAGSCSGDRVGSSRTEGSDAACSEAPSVASTRGSDVYAKSQLVFI